MSVVVAVVGSDGTAYMASDTGSFKDAEVNRTGGKVWLPYANVGAGAVGDGRFCHAVQYLCDWPAPGPNLDEWFYRDLPAALKKSVEDLDDDCDGEVVVTHGGRLVSYDGHLSPSECVDRYTAIGAGSAYALGALWCARYMDLERLTNTWAFAAVRAAAAHCAFVVLDKNGDAYPVTVPLVDVSSASDAPAPRRRGRARAR